MDKLRIDGAARKAKGALKEGAGKLMGDTKLQAEGKADKLVGGIENAAGGAADAAREAGRKTRERLDRKR